MRVTLTDNEIKALQAEADTLKGTFDASTKTAAKKTKYSNDFLTLLGKYSKICRDKQSKK